MTLHHSPNVPATNTNMHQLPKITIIVPVYNRADIVGKTLASIEAQTLRPLSVILVDNNSTDNTFEVLTQWKQASEADDLKITILTERRPGAAAARNRGLDATSTDYVMFFDSDDTMAPTHAARVLEAFILHPNLDIVGWDINMHLLNGAVCRKPFYANDVMWHCVMHGSMGTQRWAAKTELVKCAGEWNPGIMGWNDIELGSRMLLLNPHIKKLSGCPTVDVYSQIVSITGTDFASGADKWERSLDAIETSMPCRRLRRYANLRRALLAGDYAREGAKSLSDRLLGKALAKESCQFYRVLLKIARLYVAGGNRGAARLLRPFF